MKNYNDGVFAIERASPEDLKARRWCTENDNGWVSYFQKTKPTYSYINDNEYVKLKSVWSFRVLDGLKAMERLKEAGCAETGSELRMINRILPFTIRAFGWRYGEFQNFYRSLRLSYNTYLQRAKVDWEYYNRELTTKTWWCYSDEDIEERVTIQPPKDDQDLIANTLLFRKFMLPTFNNVLGKYGLCCNTDSKNIVKWQIWVRDNTKFKKLLGAVLNETLGKELRALNLDCEVEFKSKRDSTWWSDKFLSIKGVKLKKKGG